MNSKTTILSTIGYEGATVEGFLAALEAARIELVVDVRALANSRRPGFAKTRLTANLAGAGMEYLHLRGLGTPADGRAAAHAGRHEEMRRVFLAHLRSPVAQTDLETLESIVTGGRRVCLLCLEAKPEHCHRSMVAAALGSRMPLEIRNLVVRDVWEE